MEERSDHYVFTASFVDFETGFNLQRVFKQRKEQNIGMKDTARAEDITFQIGQSKALRNVVLGAMPTWLTKKMLDKAKEQVIDKITKMGLPVAQKKALEFFEKHGITVDRVEKKMAKNHNHWTAEDLTIIQGAMGSLVNGQESAESLFPEVSEGAAVATNKKATDLKAKIAEKQKSQTEKKAKGTGETKPAKVETEEAETATEPPVNEMEDPSVKEEETKEEDFVSIFNKLVEDNGIPAENVTKELLDLGYESPDGVKGETDQNIVLQYFKDTFVVTG